MDAPALPESLQAFTQILMARKVMSEDEARKSLEESYQRFENAGFDLAGAISRVDHMLDCMDMGVRSMRATGPDGVTYHCLVNKSADEIAKLYGSKLEDWQVEVFKAMLSSFGQSEEGRLTLADLRELKTSHKNVKNEDIKAFAEQLVAEFWLARPQNSVGYSLGVRTYVELPELLKSMDLVVPQIIHH